MGAFLDGPFYSHTQGYDPQSMLAAIEHLEDVIDEAGPFDGVLGFSQGAAVALSYLHLRQSLNEPSAFKFALCFSSVMPCSADIDFGQGIIQRICSLEPNFLADTGTGAHVTTSATMDEVAQFCRLLHDTVIPAQKNSALLPDYDMAIYTSGNGATAAPRLMHRSLTETRIRIPTIHVSGKRDAVFMRNMSEAARGLCEDGCLKRLEHSGGHQPPQKDAEVKAAIRAMDWAIRESSIRYNL